MSLNAFLDGLDSVERSGRFFVEITERLGDGELNAGEDITRLARALGVQIPPELAGASIVSLGSEEAARLATEPGIEIVVHYPPKTCPPGPGQAARKFKKCFPVCQSVGGAKVCVKVCIEIDIGLGGISGEVSATVSVKF